MLQVVLYRWNIYNTFLLVPTAVVRGLASRVIALLEDAIGGDNGTGDGERQEVRVVDGVWATSMVSNHS